MDTETNFGVIINLNSNYSNFEYRVFSFPVFLALLPFFYIIPTCGAIYQTIRIYIDKGLRKRDDTVNRSVFLVIILFELSCLGFFISDFFTIRLPSTGIVTTWCQQIEPNRILAFVFTSQVFFFYTVLIYPVLLTVVRLVPIYFPHKHLSINSKILCYCIPLTHIYPLVFLFFMWPTKGVCRQLQPPFEFGSIFIHFIGSWNDLINAPFQVVNLFFWLSVCLIANARLYQKLQKLKNSHCRLNTNEGVRYRKAEVSLTLTTTAMILAYITNIIFLGTFIIDIKIGTFFGLFRPYSTDLELCVVTWVFYLTHPAFRNKTIKHRSTFSTFVA